MNPLIPRAVAFVAHLWLDRRATRKEKRRIRQENQHIPATTPLEGKPVNKQVLQGGLTYTGVAVSMIAFWLHKLDIVPPGIDAATSAAVLVGLVLAAYGRFRRERRDG